jgi:C1A family cysteine protease
MGKQYISILFIEYFIIYDEYIIMMTPLYKLNYTFQKKDTRDYKYTTSIHPNNILETTTIVTKNGSILKAVKISPSMFIIPNLPPIINQGNLGSCVSNAFSYCISKQTKNKVTISRLFLYAICRCIDYTPLDQDNGTTIRTACQVITNYGVCKESLYPYNINNFIYLPPLNVFNNSKKFIKFIYLFINQDITSIKNCLNAYKCPIIFGFLVYSSFMSDHVANTGNVPIPDVNNDTLEGGHCMSIVGYNDTTQMFTCANSWGNKWGNGGYCYIPYNYLLNPDLAADFCCVNNVI